MKYAEGQILTLMARVLFRHAEIVSGAYKFHQTQVGCGYTREKGYEFRDMTDDEKLKDTLATMGSHIDLLYECVEHIGETENDGKQK